MNFTFFTGTANPALADAIARELDVEAGRCTIGRYPDGETAVRLEQSVRGQEVIFVQPTAPPVNDHLIELLAFADACRRAGAARITAVVPYFGYARSDTSSGRSEPVMARLAAELMEDAGIAQVFTVDPHTPQLEGFFRIPFHHLTAATTFYGALKGRLPGNAVVVSPDLGRVETAADFGDHFNLPVAALHKRRVSGARVEMVQVIGAVRGRSCLIVDDMISTGGTIVQATRALHRAGAKSDFIVAATHGVLVEGARERLTEAGVREVWITDTIARHDNDWPELRVISVAPLIAAALQRVLEGESQGEPR